MDKDFMEWLEGQLMICSQAREKWLDSEDPESTRLFHWYAAKVEAYTSVKDRLLAGKDLLDIDETFIGGF